MLTEVPARTGPLPIPKKTARVVGYEGRELLKYLLNREFLRVALPWYNDFLMQQHEIREMYRVYAKSARFTKSKNISVGGEFYMMCRIPSNLVEIMCSCDPELDGTSDAKLELFLKDHPDFDLRVRGD